jgi:alkylation response protein AidB-like acyl-CoA dehydrogenase
MTHAHFADHIFCLVRANIDGRPQQGISFLLIEMSSPGIRVEPIITLAGDHELNQVFFDDVRVPVANRVGDENQGWTTAGRGGELRSIARRDGFRDHVASSGVHVRKTKRSAIGERP